MDKKISPVLLMALLFIMVGCDSTESVNNDTSVIDQNDYLSVEDFETDNFDYDVIEENNQSDLNDGDENSVEKSVASKLVVDGTKCIGCGKCAKTTSDYFAMQSGKAVVVSQEDIDVSAVERSISNCPVNAISIV